MLAALTIIDQLAAALVGLLNIMGATQKVSDIIAARIAAGRTTWTDEERDAITSDLAASKNQANIDIGNAGG